MAAYSAGRAAADAGRALQVVVLEKMPRPGRKIMITGKGRCNFTNVKSWNEFSGHVQSKSNFVKSAFYGLDSQGVVDFFEGFGMKTVVERGDRAFPASYHSSDVVDTLVSACHSVGVKIECESEVSDIEFGGSSFKLTMADGVSWLCSKLIIATGGLSYPTTGSTGDGLKWAAVAGHKISQTFPALTALVPKRYKLDPEEPVQKSRKKSSFINRETPLSELGQSLCGIQLKNVQATLFVDGNEARSEFGDIDFTDGGIEGPIGFTVSRNCVKAIINGGKARITVDMKPGVEADELKGRVKGIWNDIQRDPRSRKMSLKEMLKILLGKLMPWDLIPGFTRCNPDVLTGRRGNEHIDMDALVSALKEWKFDIEGYVGYERCVVTAGGVSTDEVIAKTMESRLRKGLYLCGEVLDIDSDTGGYNLQTAFSTGYLAGQNAAKAALQE